MCVCVCVRTHAHAQGFGNNKGFIEHLFLLEISLNFYVATLAWHEIADYKGSLFAALNVCCCLGGWGRVRNRTQ